MYSIVASRREICNIHIVRHRFIKDLAYYTNFLLLAYQHRLSNCGQNQWHFERVEAYEEGESNVDDDLNILFIPVSNPSGSYSGYFENDKKNFKVSLPGLNNREISFLEN